MDFELGQAQTDFARIIWEHEPVSSGKLVELAGERLHWKKSTTYTVLRKLCDKGLFQNEGGVVTARVSADDFFTGKTWQIVDTAFHNSLPAFVAAYVSKRDLTPKEAEEIRALIDRFRKEGSP